MRFKDPKRLVKHALFLENYLQTTTNEKCCAKALRRLKECYRVIRDWLRRGGVNKKPVAPYSATGK